jgi:hypothetical protein
MNLLGKIFTVLILLMSVCFFMISVMVGASQQNWKEQAMELKALIETERLATEQAISQKNSNLIKLENLQVAKLAQISYLESRRVGLLQQIDAKDRELSGLLETSRQLQESLAAAERRLNTQDQSIADLRTENKDKSQKIAGMTNRVVELTNSIYELDAKIQNLNQTKEALASQVAQYTRAIAFYQIDPYNLAEVQPDVSGIVSGVNGDLMTFTIGNDDGIIKDKEIFITRNGRFMAKAIITVVKDNEAAARILPESVQSPIEKGDNVRTTLSNG